MNVAFYAPMKPPDSPVPSGDRRMGRSIMAALRAGQHDVVLASRFCSRDGTGDPERQARLRHIGEQLAERLVRRYSADPTQAPDVWFTYHVYYKAPDWIGPKVAAALDIPYVIAEASHAPKRANGPWNIGFQGAVDAISRADRIFELNPVNTVCVRPLMEDANNVVPLPPFLDAQNEPAPDREKIRGRLARAHSIDPEQPWLLTVAMMRDGAKMASYQVLAEALDELAGHPWQLLVVGDGPMRERVTGLMPANRTSFLGEQSEAALAGINAAADVFVWPAVNEAYGMAILEAQRSGVPVVAGDAGGVAAIVQDGETGILVTEGDAKQFAKSVADLLDDHTLRHKMGAVAAQRARKYHSLEAAATTLDLTLRELVS